MCMYVHLPTYSTQFYKRLQHEQIKQCDDQKVLHKYKNEN